MSTGHVNSRRRVGRLLALGAGAVTVGGWALQHRAVSRSAATVEEMAAEGLTMPDDLRHHFVDVDDGGRIHVVERGQGPALVLLHGFMLSSGIWVHQLRDLADHHRVIAVDLRGHGQSVPGSDGFGDARPSGPAGPADVADVGDASVGAAAHGPAGIRRLAADVRIVLEALDLEQAVVVGHSMGGMVGLQLLVDLPVDERRRVAGLVLVSTTAGPFTTVPGWNGLATVTGPVTARAALLAERWGVKALPSRDLRWWVVRMGFGAEAPPVQVRFVEAMHVATPSSTLAGLLGSLARFDLSGELGSFDVPVLVVVGTHDRLTAPRHARHLADALPAAELVELPRCGHMPMLERRHEFSRLLDEFSRKLR
jgi:pimeloyl-ACP methyl ester carboxylesterase